MAVLFNILTDAPTIIYPNGGEILADGVASIQWIEPSNVPSSEMLWYEIFITDFYDADKKPELLHIATIPYGNSSYSYNIHKNLKGNQCRVGIRAVNHEGLRSKVSFSAADFAIINKELPSPSMVEPQQRATYYSYIPIVFDHSSILGRCSQRSFYQIYYSSESLGIDWTLLRSNIMVGSDPFDLDVSGFSTASDYSLKIELVDDINVSSPVFISDLIINNINYFLIDTTPPKGTIKISDNTEYIKERNLIVNLNFYDKTSAVKEFRIEQEDVGVEEQPESGDFADVTSWSTWDVSGDDGVKLIKVRFKDYAGNMIYNDPNANYFRTYKNLGDREVTSLLYDNIDGDLYMAFALSSTANAQLYKNLTLLSTLDGDATSLKFYNSMLYIAIKDSDNKGILQRFNVSEVESVADNDSQYLDADNATLNSLYFSDSVINSMEVFDNKLFLGLENGILLSFGGSTISTEHSSYLNARNIYKIKTDGNVLYIFFSNSSEIMVMDKDASSNYTFTMIDTGN